MATIKGRKDSKGYVLRTGETCRADGRYCYAYTDRNKVRRYVYAKSLQELRAKEKELLVKYEQGLDAFAAKKITLTLIRETHYLNLWCIPDKYWV